MIPRQEWNGLPEQEYQLKKQGEVKHLNLMLAHTANGEDDSWPQWAVNSIIEQIRTKSLLEGIRTARFNLHGRAHAVTGGVREKAVAGPNQKAAAKFRTSPRTASMLRELASTFTRMARREEAEADLREQTDQ